MRVAYEHVTLAVLMIQTPVILQRYDNHISTNSAIQPRILSYPQFLGLKFYFDNLSVFYVCFLIPEDDLQKIETRRSIN